MTGYLFSRRDDVEALLELLRRQPGPGPVGANNSITAPGLVDANPYNHHNYNVGTTEYAPHGPQRLERYNTGWIFTNPEEIPGRSGTECFFKKCTAQSLQQNAQGEWHLEIIKLDYPAVGNAEVDVWNISETAIPVDSIFNVIDVWGTFVAIPETVGGGGPVTPRVRFKTLEKIAYRKVLVEVDWLVGSPVDPDTSLPLSVGDQFYVHDIQNNWPTLEANCLGMAFYRAASAGPPATDARWEIESCTRPVNRVRAYLEHCMKKCDGEATVEVMNPEFRPAEGGGWSECRRDGNGPKAFVDMSHGDERVLPPELNFQGNIALTLNVTNPWALEGKEDGAVVIRRVTDAWFADLVQVEGVEGSAVSHLWEIEHVEDQKARWIHGEIISGLYYMLLDHWDGFDPRDCGLPELLNPLEFCALLPGEEFFAHLDPKKDKYVVVSTMSATMGKPKRLTNVMEYSPDTRTTINFEDCVLNYPVQPQWGWTCQEEAYDGAAAFTLDTLTAVTDIYVSGSSIYGTRVLYDGCSIVSTDPSIIVGTDCDETS